MVMDKELVRRDIEMMITDQLFEARYGNRQHLGTPKINGKPEGFPEDGQYRNLRRHHPDRGSVSAAISSRSTRVIAPC